MMRKIMSPNSVYILRIEANALLAFTTIRGGFMGASGRSRFFRCGFCGGVGEAISEIDHWPGCLLTREMYSPDVLEEVGKQVLRRSLSRGDDGTKTCFECGELWHKHEDWCVCGKLLDFMGVSGNGLRPVFNEDSLFDRIEEVRGDGWAYGE